MDEAKIFEAFVKLSAQIADVKDNLAQRLDAIHSDITVNMARADRAIDGTAALRAEFNHMSQELAALTRNQRQLTERVDRLDKPN
jgi:uncharacterized protein involved in exopolysaccharide biosynthesis